MRPFHFRYQRLLALAEQERRQAALALATALRAVDTASAQRGKAILAQRSAARRNRYRLQEGTLGWLLAADTVYRVDLAEMEVVADRQLAAAQRQADECRDAYQEAHRRGEVYRRLRHRAWERFHREALRREQVLLDEVHRHRGTETG